LITSPKFLTKYNVTKEEVSPIIDHLRIMLEFIGFDTADG